MTLGDYGEVIRPQKETPRKSGWAMVTFDDGDTMLSPTAATPWLDLGTHGAACYESS
jgi:hypothetical protein